jgi:filamin
MKIMVTNTRVITAYGDGLHHGLYDKLTTFMIDTKNMQGDLKIRIENSNSIIKNTLEKINESLYKVTYIPIEVGVVNINIKWNGKDIINSPFKAIITNPGRFIHMIIYI